MAVSGSLFIFEEMCDQTVFIKKKKKRSTQIKVAVIKGEWVH